MVSGLAPGSDACTEMVGKSTWGSGETGSSRNAMAPASATPNVNNVVATGRSMNGADRFIAVSADHSPAAPESRDSGVTRGADPARRARASKAR